MYSRGLSVISATDRIFLPTIQAVVKPVKYLVIKVAVLVYYILMTSLTYYYQYTVDICINYGST